MKINVENMLKIQAQELNKDANFAYDDNNQELNYDSAHMIAQKTLLRVDVLDSLLNNTLRTNDIQKSTTRLTKKMLKQTQEDIDYMYPNGNIQYDNCHVVMQLIKRTGEDLSSFLECFEQKHEMESKIDMVQILKEQFKEYNNDIDYAYPHNNYNDDNAHIVLQGLLGKSEFLYQVLDNVVTVNEEEKEFKNIYLDKMSGLIELLNGAYSQEGYYLNNGHDIFSQLIEGLKVEINDIQNIRLSSHEEIENVNILSDSDNNIKLDNIIPKSENSIEHKPVTVQYHQDNIDKKEDEFEQPVRNEEAKKKFKSIM